MLFKAFVYERLYERLVKKVEAKGGIHFWRWDCTQEQVVSLYKKGMPIPCVDRCGTHYWFYDGKYLMDGSEIFRWIHTELPKIQKAAIEAAASDKCSISIGIGNSVSSNNVDVSIWLPRSFIKLLKEECGKDCTLAMASDDVLVLSWDD